MTTILSEISVNDDRCLTGDTFTIDMPTTASR